MLLGNIRGYAMSYSAEYGVKSVSISGVRLAVTAAATEPASGQPGRRSNCNIRSKRSKMQGAAAAVHQQLSL
jgi:hypothetical protein